MEEGLEIRAALVRVVIDGQELLGIVPTSDRFERSKALAIAKRMQRTAEAIADDLSDVRLNGDGR